MITTSSPGRRLLRRAAAGQPTFDLDLQNLSNEIESLSRRDRRALATQLARIIEHLLKLQHTAAAEPRRGWENSVDVHRTKVLMILAGCKGPKSGLATI